VNVKAFAVAGRAVSQGLLRGWRRALAWRAEDISGRSAHASCMVLGPHPVYETIGCGATIARKRVAGTKVTVVIGTDGRYSTRSEQLSPAELARLRAEEALRAAAVLGVPATDVVFLPHDDLSLVLCVPTLVDELTEIIQRIGVPDEILVTSARDGHTDHVALNEAARRLRPVLGARCRVLEYPTWYWYAGPSHSTGPSRLHRAWRTVRKLVHGVRTTPTLLVSTDGYLTDKSHALACYASQTTKLTGESQWQTLPVDFLSCFLGAYEVFFPLL
jgi:LmbE family N-acetylglucosaminyl deacetylase